MVIADPWRLQDRIKTHLQMAQPYSFNLVTAPTLQNWGQGPSLSSTAGLEDRSLLPGAGQDRTSPNLHQLVSTSNFYHVLDQIHHLSSVPISVLASNSVSGTESEISGQGPSSQSWSRQTSPLGKYVSLSLNSDSKVIIYFLYHLRFETFHLFFLSPRYPHSDFYIHLCPSVRPVPN